MEDECKRLNWRGQTVVMRSDWKVERQMPLPAEELVGSR